MTENRFTSENEVTPLASISPVYRGRFVRIGNIASLPVQSASLLTQTQFDSLFQPSQPRSEQTQGVLTKD